LEETNALAKQEYCMEFMETLEELQNCGHSESTCLPSGRPVKAILCKRCK